MTSLVSATRINKIRKHFAYNPDAKITIFNDGTEPIYIYMIESGSFWNKLEGEVLPGESFLYPSAPGAGYEFFLGKEKERKI